MKTTVLGEKKSRGLTRRSWLKASLLAAAVCRLPSRSLGDGAESKKLKGRIRQSVVTWCFKPMSVEELCGHAKQIGLESVELVQPEHFATIQKAGLRCAIASSHGFAKGFAHTEEHNECLKILRTNIEAAARFDVPSIITFSGFRRGLSDEVATKNMIDGLKKIVPFAEEKKVTLCLEMLNSRVNLEMKGHPDYFCDDLERTVDICKQIGSGRMKVLFDIYHVQIMHGDIIARLRQHLPYIAHIHTAGVPGRGEIDDTQELNYPPIMRAIAESDYKGFVGQEFIPTRDKVKSLAQAFHICDV